MLDTDRLSGDEAIEIFFELVMLILQDGRKKDGVACSNHGIIEYLDESGT